MKMAQSVFFSWLPFAVVICGMCVLVYAAVQQEYRQSLNDPQIQMVDDAVSTLQHTGAIEAVVPPVESNTIDIAQSLQPWIALYDEAGDAPESTGQLHGETPTPPQGVFDAARSNTGKDTGIAYENRVTWQPEQGVREALVMRWMPERQIWVVAGRNMREVEHRESSLALLVGTLMIIMLAASLMAVALREWILHR